MFIKYGQEKKVNLNNVSNIYIDENTRDGKVIFNMNYSVKIFGDKYTPDYVYYPFSNEKELNTIKNIINMGINEEEWILPQEQGQRYVRKDCISSISTDEYKNRVIFNLNYNISHPKDIDKLTSDFVFFNFSSNTKYIDFCKNVIEKI